VPSFRREQIAGSSLQQAPRGKLERVEGVVNVLAERIEALPLGIAKRSRDFH
jgi:error-prone DNA polymerase